jgi:phage tail sheath protein FI
MTDHRPSRPDPENEVLHAPHDVSTPEFSEIKVRHYVANLEHSVDKGTQWAVFEPNGEALWARVRSTVTDLLTAEWHSGMLQGALLEQAFFVRCDQSTMTQSDLDNGRLNIVIGVAPVRPSEFVIINVGQWTADHRP